MVYHVFPKDFLFVPNSFQKETQKTNKDVQTCQRRSLNE
jgi:phage-related protein